MEARIFTDKLYKAAEDAGINEFEIGYGRTTTTRLDVFDGQISNRTNNESQSVVLAVKSGKNIGSFSCEELEEKNIPLIINQAKENAELIDVDDENFFHDGSGEYHKVKKYQPIANLLAELDREKYLLAIEKDIYAQDRRVKKVISLYFNYIESESILKNSKGLDLADNDKVAYAVIYLAAEENGITKSADEIILFDKPEDFDAKTVAKKTVEKVVAKLNPEDITSCKCGVVFQNKTFADLLSTVSGIFSANAIQEKRSRFDGKLGQKVASDIVTLIDNPLLENGYGSRRFDREGYPAQLNEVIKDGILKTYLHNLRTAHKDGVKSTGNGSGGRGISFSNFYILPGKNTKNEVLKQTGEGVYITDLNGMHAGYSSVSGDFSFGAEGFKIKNGKIASSLNQFTISGNIYRLFENINMLGDDLEFNSGGFGAPTVMVEELAVSNE